MTLIIDLRTKPADQRVCRISGRQKASIRARLMVAQDGLCAHCEFPLQPQAEPLSDLYPTIDHVLPIALGGKNGIENLLLKHRYCNEQAGARPPSRQDRKWLAIVRDKLAEGAE